ncbi:hypothetical protein PanWU01x14_220800 [Parasponia andersonii]|uniref:Uncharacterized protein n=1 Tax=Parasponia andersonii TaxID=3476 RepID=A0A2P5BPY8_PARAD|nr:hypothetical protein PanWU01x14_220800 [Parasponia andersonii]
MSPGLHVCCSFTYLFLKCSTRAQEILPDIDPMSKNMACNPSLLVRVWPRPDHRSSWVGYTLHPTHPIHIRVTKM